MQIELHDALEPLLEECNWYGASDRQRPRLVYGSRRPRSVAAYSGLLVADRRCGWAS